MKKLFIGIGFAAVIFLPLVAQAKTLYFKEISPDCDYQVLFPAGAHSVRYPFADTSRMSPMIETQIRYKVTNDVGNYVLAYAEYPHLPEKDYVVALKEIADQLSSLDQYYMYPWSRIAGDKTSLVYFLTRIVLWPLTQAEIGEPLNAGRIPDKTRKELERAKLVKRENIKIGEYPGIAVVLKISKGTIYSRIYLAKGRLYQLYFFGSNAKAEELAMEYFNSFSLLSSQDKQKSNNINSLPPEYKTQAEKTTQAVMDAEMR